MCIRDRIAAGLRVDEEDNEGCTALHYAKDYLVAELLIKNEADKNAKDNYKRTPLHYAKDRRVLKALIRRKAKINAQDEHGRTPLHYAEGDNIKILLQAGADKNIKDNYGYKPLRYHAKLKKENRRPTHEQIIISRPRS